MDQAPLPSRGGSRTWIRVLLPILLFVVAVGVLTWVAQFLPNWRRGPTPPANTGAGVRGVEFFFTVARWEPDGKTNYVAAEFERGQQGFYDFLFQNVSDSVIELGLESQACDCSEVLVSFLSPEQAKSLRKQYPNGTHSLLQLERDPLTGANWQRLERSPDRGIQVAAERFGIVRLKWETRKGQGESLKLSLDLWSQPPGQFRQRVKHHLAAHVVVTSPVRFYPERIDAGKILPGSPVRREFWCWSPTRDRFELTVPPEKKDPCLQCEITPLSPGEMEELRKRVQADMIVTRVRSGYRVTVLLSEEKDGRYLDLGGLYQEVPLQLRADGQELKNVPLPVLVGSVGSFVRVGALGESAKVLLGSFDASEGITKRVPIIAQPGTKFKPVAREPIYLEVTIQDKGPSEPDYAWELTVTVPPGRLTGPLPERSAVVLEITTPGGMVRRIRIPVAGTAGRGRG